jgi:hypothetical protein
LNKRGKRCRPLVVGGILVLALVPGCTTNNSVTLDPLGKDDLAKTDPLRGRLPAQPLARAPGQARLMAPDVGKSASGGSSGALASSTLGTNNAALATNVRPLGDSPSAMEGSPYGGVKSSGVKAAGWTPSNGVTWDQAKQLLQARGVIWHQLEARDGQWHFRCSIPDAADPSRSRTFEAIAGDDLSAVRQVLETIDRERSQN